MVRILHLSDIHLGYKYGYLGEFSHKRQAMLKDAFIRAMDYACDAENDVRAVIIAGDLFDTYNPSREDFDLVHTQLLRLNNRKIYTLIVPGNHDGIYYPSNAYERIKLDYTDIVKSGTFGKICTKEFDGKEFHFYGMTYLPGNDTGPDIKKEDSSGYHIAALHCSVTANPEWEVHAHYLPVGLEQLINSGFDYIAMGHYHNFAIYQQNDVTACYPGTLESLDFSEPGDRYLVVLEIEDNPVVKKLKWNSLDYIKKEIKADENEPVNNAQSFFYRYLDRYHKNHAVRLILEGSVPPDFPSADEIIKFAKDNMFFLDIVDKTSVYDSGIINRLKEDNTIKGSFVRRVLRLSEVQPEKKEFYEQVMKYGLLAFEGKDSL